MMTSLLAMSAAGAIIYGVRRGVRNGTFQRWQQTISNAMNHPQIQQMMQSLKNMINNQGMQQSMTNVQSGIDNEQQTNSNNAN